MEKTQLNLTPLCVQHHQPHLPKPQVKILTVNMKGRKVLEPEAPRARLRGAPSPADAGAHRLRDSEPSAATEQQQLGLRQQAPAIGLPWQIIQNKQQLFSQMEKIKTY